MILTKKQREVYDYIQGFIENRGYSPSLEEIAQGLGLRSLATVHKHVANLIEKGMLKRAWNRGRSIEISPTQEVRVQAIDIPLLGRVAAGFPLEAVETRSSLSVPEDMLGARETFALEVRGDSMIDEQIRNGDFVIVERRDTAENGETVVALVRSSVHSRSRLSPEPVVTMFLKPAFMVTAKGDGLQVAVTLQKLTAPRG